MNNPEELKPKSEPLRSVFSGATAARECSYIAPALKPNLSSKEVKH